MNASRCRLALLVLALSVLAFASGVQALPATGYRTNTVEGWTVLVNETLLAEDPLPTEEALELLRSQLREIVRLVPAPAVAKLRGVTLWFSPEYPNVRPTAEYHPDANWLREHGRNAAMARGVEFTNVRIFAAEAKRMPNFALHELAHAYHHQFLPDGYDNKEIATAYARAKAGGAYEKVERWNGEGHPNTHERAYALTNPMEYFAESAEAFFGRNDFFPFTRDDLKKHDPEMERLVVKLWGVTE